MDLVETKTGEKKFKGMCKEIIDVFAEELNFT